MFRFAQWVKTAAGQAAPASRRTRLAIEPLEDRLAPASAAFAITEDWGSGFQASLVLRQEAEAAAAVVNWRLEFDYTGQIGNIWNAQVVSHVGNHYVIGHAGWNATLAPGDAVQIGFIGAGDGRAEPTGYVLNGVPLDGPPPTPELPSLSIADVSASEGDSGVALAQFIVSLSAPSATPVSVGYRTTDGSATAGSDYQALAGVLTFAPGETQKTIVVPVLGDTTFEPDETFSVILTDPVGATLVRDQAEGMIRNDDAAPPPPPASGDIAFTVSSDWGSGFTGDIAIRNSGATAITNWTLAFDFAGQISSIWNASIVSHSGNHYLVKPASWNSTIAAGGSVSFGFVGSPGNVTAGPANFVLSGDGLGAPANRPPVALADVAATTAAAAVNIAVLRNDSDPDGDPLTVIAVSQPGHGSAALQADGTVVYTPAAGFTGSDGFSYTVGDGRGGQATAAVAVNVSSPAASLWPDQFYAPYVDMALYPTYDLVAAARDQGIRFFTLAFVVADPQNQPAWGGFQAYRVGGSDFDLAMKAQVAGIRGLGGDVMVSFGGAANHELAEVLTDVAALTQAYQQVIDAYQLTHVDFDIEGAALADRASVDRRAQAIAGLQQSAAQAGRPLEVWFTLPVLPSGLTADGLYLLQSALAHGVAIAGVNIMAMDYGDSAAPNPQGRMGDYAIEAAASTFNQLQTLYGGARTQAELWQMIGVTPMIGLNDVTTEVFDQQEARELVAFAIEKGMGRISMWSLNRDQQNPAGTLGYVDLKSSSILQEPYEFSRIFLDYEL